MSKTERALETDEVDSTLDLDRFVTSEVEEADRAIDDLIDGVDGDPTNGNGHGNGNGHDDSTGDHSIPTGFGVIVDTTGEIDVSGATARSPDDSVPTGVVIDDPMLPPILVADEEPVDLAEVAMPSGLVVDDDLAESELPVEEDQVDEARTDVDVDAEDDVVDDVDLTEADLPLLDELGADPVEADTAAGDLVEPDEVETAADDVDVVEFDDDEVEAEASAADVDIVDVVEEVDEVEVEPDTDAVDVVEVDSDTDAVDVVEVDSDVELDDDGAVVLDVVETDSDAEVAPDTEVVEETEVDADVEAAVVPVVPELDDDVADEGDDAPYVLPVIVPATGDDPTETDDADVEAPVEAREGDLDEEVSDDIIEELRRADIDGPIVDFAPQDDTTSARRAPKRRPDYDPAPMPIPARPPRVLGRKPRVRKVTRVVQHVDPWTVFKIALVAFLVLYVVLLVAGVLLWNVAYATGTIDNIERFFESFGWSSFEFNGGEIYHAAWIAGLFGVIGLTGMAVLTATLFNLITDIVGGMRFTVLEEEVVETRTSPMRRFVVRRPEPEVPAVIPDPSGDPSGTIIREAVVDDSGAIEKRA